MLGQGRDVTVYLGLAATAFLLVMLHPSKEEDVPKEASSGAQPASQGTLQVCPTLQRACCAVRFCSRQRMAVILASQHRCFRAEASLSPG